MGGACARQNSRDFTLLCWFEHGQAPQRQARPETPEEKAARIQALKDAEKYLPVVYALIAAAVGGIALYFKYLGA